MQPIKAIVLTYDKYRSFTDHMILCYEKLWPNHPFTFHVPYQYLRSTIQSSKVKYYQSPPDIKGTINTLLHDIDDEEMVYWCIDDKYPIKLNVRLLEKIHQYLLVDIKEDICGLLFCRCRGMLKKTNLTEKIIIDNKGQVWLERKNLKQIWIHQYLKVKVLRYLFNSFPEQINNPRTMDNTSNKVKKPSQYRLFVTYNNLSIFGESTTKGIITKNCLNNMKKYNLSIPLWASKVTSKEIIMGK